MQRTLTSLLRSFALGSIPGDEFDSAYFALFRQAHDAYDAGERWVDPEAAEVLLADFHSQVDRLSDDPSIFPDSYLTAEDLRPEASRVADQLEQLRRHS